MSDAPEYQHYPLMMSHPGFQPARLGTSPDDRKGTPGTRGTPMINPPVTVNNVEQEEYHRAQGYVPAGKGNPAAFVQAHTSPETPYSKVEYPKYVGDILVNSEDEELAAMARNEQMAAEAEAAQLKAEEDERRAAAMPASDVQAQIAELRETVAAMANMVQASRPEPPATVDGVRAMFEAKATALGVKIDGRWSLEKLITACTEAEAK